MHEVSHVFPGNNLVNDAPCGSSFASAPTPTTAPAPTPIDSTLGYCSSSDGCCYSSSELSPSTTTGVALVIFGC